MMDLFNFLKGLIRDEPEVIAAFLMGLIVAIVFLAYPIYKFVDWYYAKTMGALETDLKKAKDAETTAREDAQREQAELKKKAKDRKAKIEERQAELADVKTQLDDQQKKYNQLVPKYNRLAYKALSLKRQVVAQNDQAKELEKLQAQLWDVPVDKSTLTPFRQLTRSNAVIIALINLKGGVGKTTLTANIAATYCRQKNKNRVLVVDLDFQASLTGLCLPAEHFDQRKLGVDDLFKNPSSDLAAQAFSNTVRTHEPNLRILSASENLPNVEERSKASWLLHPGPLDLRCVFRKALHEAVFQDNFDVILIDCPPRWTTASINAIACCDYVLIPTSLDRVSAEAVPRLLKWLRNLKFAAPDLYGNFHVLGVLGNRANPRGTMVEQERLLWDALPEKCKAAWGASIHPFATIVREKGEIHRAADHRQFAAFHAALQPTFAELVDEMETRRCEHESR